VNDAVLLSVLDATSVALTRTVYSPSAGDGVISAVLNAQVVDPAAVETSAEPLNTGTGAVVPSSTASMSIPTVANSSVVPPIVAGKTLVGSGSIGVMVISGSA